MFFLDKLFIKWIITKCAQLGGAFMIGPFGGFMIYFAIISLGAAKALEIKAGKRK